MTDTLRRNFRISEFKEKQKMPLRLVDQLTPRVTPQTRLFTAAMLWSALGFFLAAKGAWSSHPHSGQPTLLSLALGLAFGLLKSRIVFDRVARKIISHIDSKHQRSCLGGLFSLRNWGLILVMAMFGKAIGALPMNTNLKSAIYVMVGSGLGYSSRLLWKAWRKSPAVADQGH